MAGERGDVGAQALARAQPREDLARQLRAQLRRGRGRSTRPSGVDRPGRRLGRRRAAARRAAAPGRESARRPAARPARAAHRLGVLAERGAGIALERRRLRRAPRACGPRRRGGGSGSARRRAAPASSGSTAARAPSVVEQLDAGGRRGARRRSARSSAKTRSPATPVEARCGAARPPRPSAASTSSPSSTARRASRSDAQRVGVERLGRDHPQHAAASRSAAPPVRVDELAAGERLGDRVDGEVAPGEVLPRSSRRRARVRSTCQRAVRARPRARRRTPRRAGTAARRRARASARAARSRRRRRRRGRSPPCRGRAAGRGRRRRRATPASAGERDARGGQRLALTLGRPVAVVGARDARREPAGDLVVDRAQPPRDLLGRDALVAVGADQHRLVARADRRLGAEVDGDVVHAHGAHERVAGAARSARRRCW